jgi:hypothetical protein
MSISAESFARNSDRKLKMARFPMIWLGLERLLKTSRTTTLKIILNSKSKNKEIDNEICN